jgi:hypothetical protein
MPELWQQRFVNNNVLEIAEGFPVFSEYGLQPQATCLAPYPQSIPTQKL